ncbi:MAG: squalene/phytoene synthase family protein [Anaerolineales bacterium]
MVDTAQLAHSITRKSSKQSYYTACFLADKTLADDCLKAYAYFRWADDVVDEFSSSQSERMAFVARQKQLITDLYGMRLVDGLSPEEAMIADLIQNDKRENSGLKSFIHNFFAIIEFDALRKGRTISEEELKWYASRLGTAVTDAIQHFVCNEHAYPDGENRYLAATAAHITHMLRDMRSDISEGYINIPTEYIDDHDLNLEDVGNPAFRAWVRNRVELARVYFSKGKQYLDQLSVLRCKIAGYWYCARFETILDIIERDDYVLRADYGQRRSFINWLKIAGVAVSVTIRHALSNIHRRSEVCTCGKNFRQREVL